jgi:hypothetical protein
VLLKPSTSQLLGVGRCSSKDGDPYCGGTHYTACAVNLYAPCILYIGQTYRYSPEYAFYIFSQQIYLIMFLDFLSPSSFIPPQNAVYFIMLTFLVHKIFTFYINGVLNCKCSAPGAEG